jgi:hypothetical protein
MFTPDFVTPFFSPVIEEQNPLAMDLTIAIVKLYFQTKGGIERKKGDLNNIAISYWPFYLVPINTNNAYFIEAKSLYSDRVKTRVNNVKLPNVTQDVDEASIDSFVKSIDKYVGKVEGFSNFERDEKKLDGFIPAASFSNYFQSLLRTIRQPYMDSSFSLDPTVSENAVNYTHQEVLKLFDDGPIDQMKSQQEQFESLCDKWIAKIENFMGDQIQDAVDSLKKKGDWLWPRPSDALDQTIDKLQDQLKILRTKGEEENVKESIMDADLASNTSADINRMLDDYKRNLRNLDDKVREETISIDEKRKGWQDSITTIRAIEERMQRAVRGFEDQEHTIRSKFLEDRTISFKTEKVVACGIPVLLLNFSRKGKMETTVMAPVILEEVSAFHKNPFKEPKGFSDFEKSVTDWFLGKQNEYEVQKSIKQQDLFSMPNLVIDVSNCIDKLLDLGYLDKKKHGAIRDDEVHNLFRKE